MQIFKKDVVIKRTQIMYYIIKSYNISKVTIFYLFVWDKTALATVIWFSDQEIMVPAITYTSHAAYISLDTSPFHLPKRKQFCDTNEDINILLVSLW